jgi:hypothetical protein
MKRILAVSLLLLPFAACEKNDTQLFCWECSYDKKVDNGNGIINTTKETKDVCYMTEEEARQYELRYRTRRELNVEYGDMACTKKPATKK